jgi:hypothetical protein
MVEGKPKYVTALGETDSMGGWRENKAKGGVVIDVDSGEVLARGLSMPHSPRWYAGRLWVCDSGAGTFGFIDLNTGTYQPVAETPGFTRGLDFAGSFAFVGLSQVRESAVFSGIAITERHGAGDLPARAVAGAEQYQRAADDHGPGGGRDNRPIRRAVPEPGVPGRCGRHRVHLGTDVRRRLGHRRRRPFEQRHGHADRLHVQR